MSTSRATGMLALLMLAVTTLPSFGQAQERTLRGRVQDGVTLQPVEGANVLLQDTNIGTLTRADGTFVLEGVPRGEVVLVVRLIGWQETVVTVPAGETTVTVQLTRDYLNLEELVVSGRATDVRQRNLPTAVQTIGTEVINATPQSNITSALQGKVTGAQISQNEGTPGGGLQIKLRGSTTINARQTPLWVVDGVLISNSTIGDNRGVLVNGGQSEGGVPRIADINPDEIESIEVLKGPAAAAIYGSKASNGVIIVTTKRGRAGRPEVRLSSRFGTFDLKRTIPVRNFATVEEAVGVFGPIAAEEPFATNIREGRDFDNQEEIADRNALSVDLNGSVSGGGENVDYYASLAHRNEEGIIANTGFERQSIRGNIGTSPGDRLDLTFNNNILRSSQLRGVTNNDNSQISFWMVFPNTPDFIDLSRRPDGTFPVNPFVGNGSNPLQTADLLTNEEEVFRYIASGTGDLRVHEGDTHNFTLRATGGVDFFTQDNSIFSPPELFFESFDGRPGTALETDIDNTNLNVSVNGVWELSPSDSWSLTTSTGMQFEREDATIVRLVSRDLVGGKPIIDAGTVELVTERREVVEDFGFFIQQEFLALDERLLLTGAVRFDQSSANSDDEELFIFPRAAASYRIPELGSIFDEIKFRAAFGQTGNRPLFGQEFTNLNITGRIDGNPFLDLAGSFAGELEPETQTEVEGGADISLFGGRAQLEGTVYVQFIDDLILERDLPPSTGFDTEFFNGGKLRNHGFEIGLNATPVEAGRFRWENGTTFFRNLSEITNLPVAPFFTGNFAQTLGTFQIKEGESLTRIVGTVVDENGNQSIATLGNSEPDFTFNFRNNFHWKGLSLHTLAEWRFGADVINLTELLFDLGQISEDFVDEDGTISPVRTCVPDCSGQERITGFIGGDSRALVQSASFLKLREVSLSWDLPEGVRNRLFSGFFSEVELVVTGTNLATLTPYDGLDPEVSQFGNNPFRGVDIAPFPSSRSVFLGLDVGF